MFGSLSLSLFKERNNINCPIKPDKWPVCLPKWREKQTHFTWKGFVVSPLCSAATSRSVPQGYVRPRQGPLHLRSVFGWGHSETVPPPQWHLAGVSGNRQPGGAQRGLAQRCRHLRGSQLRRPKVTDVPPGLYVLYFPTLCCCDTITTSVMTLCTCAQRQMEDLSLQVCVSPVRQLLQGPPVGSCQSLLLLAASVV